MKMLIKSKSTKIVITLLLCIFSLFYLSTIAYSAFSSTMNITGIAASRVEADVRITNFSLEEIVNATSNYEEFSKDTVATSLSFKENAYAIYKVEVTNYGETDIGIYSIDGIPEGITYELIDYNLKDKLCNNSGKCNNYATKEFYIKIIGNSISTNLILNFDFRIIHKIYYQNFTNNYIDSVIDNETILIDLSNDSPKLVSIKSNSSIDYEYSQNILVLSNVKSDITIEAIYKNLYEFDYNGSIQEFVVPIDGLYKVELWGAAGGMYSNGYLGGYGGYTSGTISLTKDTKFNVVVGGAGINQTPGYNSGGSTIDGQTGVGGGGATDIRLDGSLNSRIMIAGGGGGAANRGGGYGDGAGGAGGGLTGNVGQSINHTYPFGYGVGYGGTQTAGGTFYWVEMGSLERPTGHYNTIISRGATIQIGGLFGIGGTAAASGGGGYYGGAGSYHGGAGGGSSFISGHEGCNAINSTGAHTGKSIHYSKYNFSKTQMIDGNGYPWTTAKQSTQTGMPTHNSTGTMIGNTGNGYAKITLLDTRMQYEIKYTNIEGTYPNEIYKGKNLNVSLGENAPKVIEVYKDGTLTNDYTYTNGNLIIENITNNIEIKGINTIYKFNYTGGSQTFNVVYNGLYKVELWGASGASYDTTLVGGKGSYVSGIINLKKDENLIVNIGGAAQSTTAGYNGGGEAKDETLGLAGGGASDIRITSSVLNRIIVAAGGGGAARRGGNYGDGTGGSGGGLIGYTGTSFNNTNGYGYGVGHGGTQIAGGLMYWQHTGTSPHATGFYSSISTLIMKGEFGKGGFAAAGGGGGYYGGAGSFHGGAGGGSSFISGHNGCDAINSSSTHTGQSIHYSNYSFTDTKMIDGEGYSWTTEKGSQTGMPTHDGTSTMTGNAGNGYAKITLIRLT